MALIKCPECGREFSEFAEHCPDCGCPVDKCTELISKNNPISINKDGNESAIPIDKKKEDSALSRFDLKKTDSRNEDTQVIATPSSVDKQEEQGYDNDATQMIERTAGNKKVKMPAALLIVASKKLRVKLKKKNASPGTGKPSNSEQPKKSEAAIPPPAPISSPNIQDEDDSDARGFFQKPMNIGLILVAIFIIAAIAGGVTYYSTKVVEKERAQIEQMVRDSLRKNGYSLGDVSVVSSDNNDTPSNTEDESQSQLETMSNGSDSSDSYSSSYAAGYYTSKGKNLRVRLGPGFDYSFVTTTYDGDPVHLQRGDQVYSDGEYKNGFLHVYEGGSDSGYWSHNDGWVSAEYLR